jgi:hypothetical protein
MPSHDIDPSFDASRRRTLQVLLTTAAAGLAGCVPVRIGLGAYPREFKSDAAGRREATLDAFAGVVAPGLTSAQATVRTMLDPWYGFAAYAGYFTSELNRVALQRHGQSYPALRREEQHAIVASGLAQGGLTTRLYTGAVFLAQVASLAGMHDDAAGSPMLQFPGASGTPTPEALHYADAVAFRAPALSQDGNPA